jgi:hypothetical protein
MTLVEAERPRVARLTRSATGWRMKPRRARVQLVVDLAPELDDASFDDDVAPAHRRRVSPLLFLALGSALTFHGGLLLSGSFTKTYDAYVHLFFADHYQRGWFSTWEPRWYTGFTTVSYPPGAHQALAAVGKVVGLKAAFPIVQLAAILNTTLGIYRYSRIWVQERPAVYAAIAFVFSTCIAETVHVFGQLPTTIAIGFLLNAAPFVQRWILYGGLRWLIPAVICTAACTAGHHVTTLFGSVFIVGPVIAMSLIERFRTPAEGEEYEGPVRLTSRNMKAYGARALRRALPATIRAGIYGFGMIMSLILVVLPYWLYSARDPIAQIPIPHGSRENFLVDLNAGLAFWLIPWGFLLLALPYVFVRSLLDGHWPLTASIALAAFLGTGGTTPFPRMLLGGAFEVLTLDRFTFWAVILTFPYAGRLVESLIHGRVARVLVNNLGSIVALAMRVALVLAYLAAALLAANFAQFRRMQPDAIDPAPIVEFMDKDQHAHWRYLMLGFGDQMAWVSAQMEAFTVDGNYHSARRLPELVTTPVERLEGAKFRGVPGIGSLQQFLAVPSKYNLKFVFSNDQFYDPLLAFSGWQRLDTLINGVTVWQHEDVAPLPGPPTVKEVPMWQRIMWGTLPPAAILGAIAALAYELVVRPLRRKKADKRIRRRFRIPGTRAIDRHLAAIAAPLKPEAKPPRLHVLRMRAKRTGAHVVRPVARWRRTFQAISLLLAIAGIGAIVARPKVAPVAAPSDPVVTFYDAMDFRRFREAYDQMDPETRPSMDLFLLQRSVTDGLVASYGKVSSITTEVISQQGDQATVQATILFETSLAYYTRVKYHDVVRRSGQWYLEPEQGDVSIPPEQFVVRSDLDYLAQGRRRVTTSGTAYDDVLDRPKLRVLNARLVDWDGQLSVVGEIRNDDVQPADTSVTAQLVGADGEPVATWDASIVAKHQVMPGEVVPFRIDFEDVAGALEVDEGTAVFAPGAREPMRLDPDDVTGLDVYAKGVGTSGGLDRWLALEGLRITRDEEGAWWVEGRIRNDGMAEATVPHLLFTYRSEDGSVEWVTDEFLETAIRPQRTQSFRVQLMERESVTGRPVPAQFFGNGLSSEHAGAVAPEPILVLPAETGWWGLDVYADAFFRGVK